MRPSDTRNVVSADVPAPAYVQVANDLANRILDGSLTGRLPAERELAEDYYQVAYGTVRRAMEILRERGLIESVHGRGTFAVNPKS